MKNGKSSLAGSGLFLTIMLAALVSLGQGSLDEAKKLFSENKFDEAAKALEKELAKPDVSAELMQFGIDVNLKAGRPFSANAVVTELLKKNKNASPELLFQAAEIAELCGDQKLASSRYFSYITSTKDKGPKKDKALSYLNEHIPYLESVTMMVDEFGPESNWSLCRNNLDRFIKEQDTNSVASLVKYIFEAYPNNLSVLYDTTGMVNGNRTKFSKDENEKILNAMLSAPLPEKLDKGALYDYMRYCYNQFDTGKKFIFGMKFMDANKYAPSDEFFLAPAVQYLGSRPDAAAQKKVAEQIMSYAKTFEKTENQNAIRSFSQTIANQPKAFRELVKPDDFVRWVKLYVDKYPKDFSYSGEIGGTINVVANGFYNGFKTNQIEFLKGIKDYLDNNWTNALISLDPDNTKAHLAAFLTAVPENFQREDRESQMISRFRENKIKGKFVNSIKRAMLAGNADANLLANELCNGFITPKEAIDIVTEVYAKTGYSPMIQQIVTRMEGNGTVKGAPEFAGLKASVDQKKAGSDAVLNAANKVFAIQAKKENLPALEQAVGQFLSVYKGNVAPSDYKATTAEEYVAYKVLSHNYAAANTDYEAMSRLADRFLPRIKVNGQAWNDIGNILWNREGNDHKGKAFYKFIQQYTAMLDANKDADAGFNWQVSYAQIAPAKKDEYPLRPLFERAPAMAYRYIFQNGYEWTDDFFFKQWTDLLSNPKVDLSLANLREISNYVLDGPKKENVPESIRIAMIKKVFETSKKDKQIDADLESRIAFANSKGDLTEYMKTYAALLKTRTPYQQMATVDVFINDGTPRKDGMVLANEVLKPLLASWDVKQWRNIPLSRSLVSFFKNAQGDKDLSEADRSTAKEIYGKLSNAILSGYAMMSASGRNLMHESLVDEFVEICGSSKDNRLLEIATGVMTDTLQQEDYDHRGMVTARRIADAMKDLPPQIQYAIFSNIVKGTSNFNKTAKNNYMLLVSKLGKAIPGVIPVDKNDQAYNLFLGAQQLSEGNALEAWRLVKPKISLLSQRWKEFDYDFVIWAIEMTRKNKMYKEALETAMTLWLDEQQLSPADAAKLAIIKGDVYRDMKNFPAARIEYESLNNSARYAKTESGRMAKFRLVELLILTQDFNAARQMLERLVDSRTLEDQAEAYYLLARLEFEQKEYEQAKEYLKEVFKRVNNHVEARLLKGEVDLATKNFSNTNITIGTRELNTVVIPGKEINFQIQDNNLSIVRGGKSIPVVVTTTNGQDREKIELLPDANDNTLFAGKIQTALGKAVLGNMLLEINGNDTINYQIDPEFQKANGLNYESKSLEIKAPAKLYISSKKILSESEQDEMKINEAIMVSAGRDRIGNNKIIRPGSPVYVQVIDPDMSRNVDAPDKVYVDLSSSSGDELKNFELVETGNSTGIFEAKVETGIPFPHAVASDMKEGNDVNAVINSTKSGNWESMADGIKPKWLEIDTMTSFNFKEINIVFPNKKNIKKFKLTAALDEEEDVICTYPQDSKDENKGGLIVRMLQGSESRLQDLENRFRRNSGTESWIKDAAFKREFSPVKQEGWYISEITGAFWLEQNEEVEFKFLQEPQQNQFVYLLIDNRYVMGGQMNESGIMMVRTLFLTKGMHTIKMFARDYSKNSSIILGMAKNDGTYQPLPEDWFNPAKYPAFAEALKPKGKLFENQDGFKIVLNEPMRYRKLKWMFDDFTGNQIEVTKVSVKDDKGNQILPVDQDLTTGKTNNVLEIASGDKVTVAYSDEKRLDDNKAILTDSLSASFHDATVELCYEEVKLNDEGIPTSTLTKAKRVQKGDSLILIVRDNDEDTSEEPQTIKAELSTSSGEKLELELLEDKLTPGRFLQVFKTGDQTGNGMIKIQSGDVLTARYLDKENNKPGIPVHRMTSVLAIEGSKPEIIVYKTKVNMIEDKSPAAVLKIRQMKDKGDKRDDIKIFKEEIVATPVRLPKNASAEPLIDINSKAPLLLEVIYPEVSKHLGSKAEVRILTQTEVNAAKSEGREPKPLIVQAPVKSLPALAREKGYPVTIPNKGAQSQEDILEMGILSAVVRLQLGSAGDEVNDAVTSNDNFNILQTAGRADQDSFKVPTVIVSGSDKVTVTVNDKAGKPVAQRIVQLKSNGELELFDKSFLTPSDSVHIGQNFYVRVYDPDRDLTNDLDSVKVIASAKSGDKVELSLSETLPHSGIFTGVLKTEMKPKAVEGQAAPSKADSNTIWTSFGDEIVFKYVDEVPLDSDKPVEVVKTGKVVIGSDAEVATFTKTFKDPDMAVKTNFLMAEALFEMAKSHRALKKDDLAKDEIARGKRILEEALRDYPNTSLKAQGEFLLANLAQQLENYQEAIGRYSVVLSTWPNSEYAVKSQFQKAQCLEKMGPEYAMEACEEYVKLTYLYPDSALAADAKIRLGNFYYKSKKYKSASTIFRKFAENHPGHPLASKSLFLAGHAELRNQAELIAQCQKQNVKYTPNYDDAIKIFKDLVDKFSDDNDIRAEAMYWLGDTYFKSGGKSNQEKSYQVLKKLTWDYPESKWAKIARGRLVEQEAN